MTPDSFEKSIVVTVTSPTFASVTVMGRPPADAPTRSSAMRSWMRVVATDSSVRLATNPACTFVPSWDAPTAMSPTKLR